MKRILVIQTAFIGDAILATGVLEKLHAFYPEAGIDYLVRKGNEGLFTGHPYLHSLLVWDKTRHKYGNLFKLLRQVRASRYDAVINLQRFAATGILTAFSGAGQKVGFDKNPLSFLFTRSVKHIAYSNTRPLHEIERNNLLIEQLTDARAARPRLYITPEVQLSVAAYTAGKFICIAPASVWFTKQLPAQKWIDLINSMDASYTIYLLGAPGDAGIANEIMKHAAHAGVVSLMGKLSLLQSAAVMQQAQMNYVNDSAPMHLASSLNAPVTAVYCSTVPEFGYGPLSDQRFIVQTTKPLECKPCGIHGHAACPEKHFACALSISNDQLLATLPPV